MTGLSAYGNYLYLGSRNQNRIYRYTLPNITSMASYTYLTGYSMTCDIALNGADNLVWVASENSSIAVKCYDNNNTMVDYITTDLIPNARGMALDPSGYLWISDVNTDKIHQVDLTEGIGATSAGVNAFNLEASANPFYGAVTIQAPGVTASVTVFDMYGRQVESDSFQESWTWNSSAPAGSYVFVVSDESGNVETLDLVKI
ncbi:MAG TPA: hypothetical protein PK907_05650 [Candidatus Sabulitectum sp.]|nr:hypothetical protein [Candidatus Sabulitectum sp.]